MPKDTPPQAVKQRVTPDLPTEQHQGVDTEHALRLPQSAYEGAVRSSGSLVNWGALQKRDHSLGLCCAHWTGHSHAARGMIHGALVMYCLELLVTASCGHTLSPRAGPWPAFPKSPVLALPKPG